MLLPYHIVVDVITTEEDVTSSILTKWQMVLSYDVVVGVETTQVACYMLFIGKCYLPSGRWNSHHRVVVCW